MNKTTKFADFLIFSIMILIFILSCSGDLGSGSSLSLTASMDEDANVIFLHRSVGQQVYDGGVQAWIANYNSNHSTSYSITERDYPSGTGYGTDNYPYDYWNIWVNHDNYDPYLSQTNLESLTSEYDVIVWKHCFTASNMIADNGPASVSSSEQTRANYILQYEALRIKMRSYPGTRFIVWTGPAIVESQTDAVTAQRSNAFYDWVTTEWDDWGDNIYVWDFRELEIGSNIYLPVSNAQSSSDSHPNASFASSVAPYLGQRIVDVIEGRGDTGSLTGE
ncbi:MAG: hypothetical protein GY874_18260 [Desulfobacteraceae bacterium]|nr:hypothetical protein [Desulfobacteraceae bacterium]